MYLKSIEIQGFKSFADKTLLSFLPPMSGRNSITTIVGPNGSGKSNVSDAVRWVMGEQKMTQLRGKKSEDVIFAGSASKGAMSMASVMMTLDNRDGRGGIEAEEIVLGRRLYRSGESEYIINGNVVRLLDLQLLLARAQFGQGSYAIIGQGMIDRMLLQSAEERKAFFDEASGIKEFQIKRHQASLRLIRTTEHIAQAELLLEEISPRLKLLSRQMKKLEERREVEIQLREQQESYYATMIVHYNTLSTTTTAERTQVETELAKTEQQLLRLQEELAVLAHAKTRQDVFGALQEEYEAATREQNTLERERAILDGKLQTEYSRVGQQQVGWLEGKVGELRARQTDFARQVVTLEEEKSRLSREFEQTKQHLGELEVEKAALKSEIMRLESGLLKASEEQTLSHFTGMRAVQAVLEAAPRLGDIRGAVAQLGKTEKRYQLALDTAGGSHLSSLIVADEEVARRGINYLREGQLGTATFLPITKIRPREIPPFVYGLLSENGVHGLAIELLHFKPEYQAIFAFVFGSTVVVEDFDTAKRIGVGRVRMVTLTGDLFETTGAIKGGWRKQSLQGLSFGDASSAHSRALETKALEEQIVSKQQEYEKLENVHLQFVEEARTKQNEKNLLEQKVELLLSEKSRVDAELFGFEQDLNLQTMSPEQFGEAMKKLNQQRIELDEQILIASQKLATASQKIAHFNQEEEAKKTRVFALQDEMQVLQLTVNALVQQKNDLQVTLAKVQTRQEDIEQELQQELQISRSLLMQKQVPTVEFEKLESIVVEIQKLKYKLSLIGGIDTDITEEYEVTKARHEGLFAELTDLKKAFADLETMIEELDEVMRKKRNRAFKQIRSEFSRYFRILFEGGEADLIELYGEATQSESADEDASLREADEVPLNVVDNKKKKILLGIDVSACPPGKKIKHLQALSGGERTLTSIALMCAILKTNPSPFVILDEVEAALDEANTLRVVNIIKELSHDTQFVIITHNRVTMHAADALYGVTMGTDGMSRLLSVKMGAETVV